jgi:hypothetical protein
MGAMATELMLAVASATPSPSSALYPCFSIALSLAYPGDRCLKWALPSPERWAPSPRSGHRAAVYAATPCCSPTRCNCRSPRATPSHWSCRGSAPAAFPPKPASTSLCSAAVPLARPPLQLGFTAIRATYIDRRGRSRRTHRCRPLRRRPRRRRTLAGQNRAPASVQLTGGASLTLGSACQRPWVHWTGCT